MPRGAPEVLRVQHCESRGAPLLLCAQLSHGPARVSSSWQAAGRRRRGRHVAGSGRDRRKSARPPPRKHAHSPTARRLAAPQLPRGAYSSRRCAHPSSARRRIHIHLSASVRKTPRQIAGARHSDSAESAAVEPAWSCNTHVTMCMVARRSTDYSTAHRPSFMPSFGRVSRLEVPRHETAGWSLN